MDEGFWMVWCPQGGTPQHKHTSLDSAVAEAKRLAAQNTGREFVVLQSVGVAKRVDVEFTQHHNPIPF
ncbi:hypothetical protein [Castellaniella sp. GW247-6E4]|uniref:hypothetical protein n=1 Tax=Castellaniella sp. GW247-6E4 TaxID=3140380 RepID=UPI003314F43A